MRMANAYVEKAVSLDNFLGKTWEPCSQFHGIFPVFGDQYWKNLGPESVAAMVCVIVNGKGKDLESGLGFSVIADQRGTEPDVVSGSRQSWRHE